MTAPIQERDPFLEAALATDPFLEAAQEDPFLEAARLPKPKLLERIKRFGRYALGAYQRHVSPSVDKERMQELVAGGFAGMGEMAAVSGAGIAGWLAGDQPEELRGLGITPAERLRERLMERAKMVGGAAPETAPGQGGRIVGGLAQMFAQIGLTGGRSGATTLPGKVLAGAARSLPFTAVQAAAGPEYSLAQAGAEISEIMDKPNAAEFLQKIADDPKKRLAFDAIFDFSLGLGFEVIAPVWRAVRGTPTAGEAAQARKWWQNNRGGGVGTKPPVVDAPYADQPEFYSRLTRAVEETRMQKGTGAEWRNYLDNQVQKGKLTKDELDWTMEDYLTLNADKKLSREDVLDALQQGRLGWAEPSSLKNARFADKSPWKVVYRNEGSPLDGSVENAWRTREEADAWVARITAKNDRSGLPGGYVVEQRATPPAARALGIEETTLGYKQGARERLQVLDDKLRQDGKLVGDEIKEYNDLIDAESLPRTRGLDTKFEEYTEPGGTNYREVLIKQERGPGQKNPHWPEEEDVLVSLRLNDRVGPNGEKVLFVEEIQSDWHQAGRKRGYQRPGLDTSEAQRATEDAATKLRAAETAYFADSTNPVLEDAFHAARLERTQTQGALDALRGGVPAAPMKKTEQWTGLAWRRILNEATDGGYDRIAWTTGDMQASRYDLSQHFDEIGWERTADGKYSIRARSVQSGEALARDGLSLDQLEDHVGKSVARRMVDSPESSGVLKSSSTEEAEKVYNAAVDRRVETEKTLDAARLKHTPGGGVSSHPEYTQARAAHAEANKAFTEASQNLFQGEPVNQLAVSTEGGAGLQRMYEKILPKEIQRTGKKLGQVPEIETTTLGLEAPPGAPAYAKSVEPYPGSRSYWEVTDENGKFITNVHGEGVTNSDALTEAARRMVDDPRSTSLEDWRHRAGGTALEAPSIRVTPEVKDAVRKKGLYLYGGFPNPLHHLAADVAVGAVGGAAAGASVDEENRLRGALVGTAVGAGGARALTKIGQRALRGVTGSITKAKALDADLAKIVADLPKADVPTTTVRTRKYINTDRLGNLPVVVRDEVTNRVNRLAQEMRGVPRTRETFEQTTEKAARLLGTEGETLVKNLDTSRMTREEVLAVASLAHEKLNRFTAMREQLNDVSLTFVERAELHRVLDDTDDEINQLLVAWSKGSSEQGRNLNANKILANLKLDPEYWLMRAQRMLGDNVPITPGQRDIIRTLVNDGDRNELVRYLASLRRASVPEQLVTLRNAGLLTNPVGRMWDIVGNALHLTLEQGVNVPARILLDMTLARSVGRTATRVNYADVAKGAADGIGEAYRGLGGRALTQAPKGKRIKAWIDHIRQSDMPPAIMKRYDIPRQVDIDLATLRRDASGARDKNAPFNVMLDLWQKLWFRVVGAPDAIIRTAAYRGALSELAGAQALREHAPDVAARTRELTQNPTPEMTANAMLEGERVTFQNDEMTAKMTREILRTPGKLATRHAGQAVGGATEAAVRLQVPFQRTPANIVAKAFDYTPAGFIRGTWNVWESASLKALDTPGITAEALRRKRQGVEVLARAGTGLGLIALGGYLVREGVMTGAYPTDRSEREAWAREGKQANSILIEGEWRPVGRYAPGGMVVAVGATMQQLADDADAESGLARAGTGVAAVGRTLLDQPLMTGTSTILESIQDPAGSGSRALNQMAGSLVPSVSGAVARRLDEGRSRVADSPLEAMQAKIPIANQLLPSRRTALGDPVHYRNAIVDPFAGIEDVRPNDQLIKELSRLDARISPLARIPDESSAQYEQRQISVGKAIRERLERMMGTPAYQRVDDDRKRERIEDAVRDIRRTATRRRKAGERQR